MKMRGYTPKEIISLFIEHGWKRTRHSKSSHMTFEKEGFSNHVTIVANSNKEICRPLARRLLKDAGIAL